MSNSEKVYSNVINQFSARIIYEHENLKSPNIGSGVLVKINYSSCYLITAKHNFKLEEDEKYWNVDIDILNNNLEKIHISNDNTIKICVIDELVFHDDRYDLLVFSLVNWSEELKKIPIIKLNKTLNFKEKDFYFYGYPDTKGTPSGKLNYEGHLNKKENQHIFRLDKNKIVKSDSLDGFSGSGIFMENEDNYYLVGLFTEFGNDHDFYYGIDLNYVFDEVDKIFFSPILSHNYSHIIPRDGYIEPRMVEIEELGLHVAVCPVTFEEYDLYCQNIGLRKEDYPKSFRYKFPRGNYPVINVNWNDAVKYCKWLNTKTVKFKYRLPYSTEWDTIAKLNTINIEKLDDYIWHRANTNDTIKKVATTKKVGSLGIFDMYGNINEWCYDNYDDENKIIKGESFNHLFENLDMELNYCLQNESKKLLGFRIVANKIIS